MHEWAARLSGGARIAPAEERVHMDHPEAHHMIGDAIARLGGLWAVEAAPVVVLCIGTDRSIGDALGPLIGSELENFSPGVEVMGTLDEPVHAGNLAQAVEALQSRFERPFVLAVDACLGRQESVGTITVGHGSLKPGAGVNKALPPVGDMYLHGVVNVGGFMEYFVLQNTRLGFVARMARVAAEGIRSGLRHLGRSASVPRERV